MFDEVSASWSQCSVNLSISRQVLRLFEAPQELLLFFSYLSVSRFSINFSKVFDFSMTFELIKTSSEHGTKHLQCVNEYCTHNFLTMHLY